MLVGRLCCVWPAWSHFQVVKHRRIVSHSDTQGALCPHEKDQAFKSNVSRIYVIIRQIRVILEEGSLQMEERWLVT